MTYQLPTPAQPLNIGTRGSLLALAQANEVRDRLAAAFDLPFEAFTIVVIKTTGDKIIDRPLKEIGGKGCSPARLRRRCSTAPSTSQCIR